MTTDKQDDKTDLLFAQLVLSFQAAAWQQMGKIVNPISGKIERNLEMAKSSIDILGMLEAKTKGNLNEHEGKFLKQVLTELRLNYVEEQKKPQQETEGDKVPEKQKNQKGNGKEDDNKKE